MLRSVARARVFAAMAVAAIAVGVGACASAPESKNLLAADPNSSLGLPALIGLDPIVKPETLVLDDDSLTQLDTVTLLNANECLAEQPSALCAYELTFTELPDGLKMGSVLVAGVSVATPTGILVVVDQVNGSVVQATQATLSDALEQGEFLFEQSFGADDIASEVRGDGVTPWSLPSASGGAPRHATALRQEPTAFSYSIDTEVAPGVRATGNVSFSIGCGAYGGLTWETVLGVPVYPNGAYFDARCGATQDGSITITGSAGVSVAEEVEITTLNLEPITFFVGPVPIVLVPQIIITAHANGEVVADMSVGASEHFGATAGITYSDGFSLVKDFGFDFSDTVDTGSGRLSLTAGVSAKEALMLYGIAGPRLTETLYLDLQGKPLGERPIWCLRGGISAGASLALDLGVQNLEWGPAELFNESKELGCAENTAPKVSIVYPEDGAVVYPGTAISGLRFYGNAYDEEDGALPLYWSSDIDGDLGVTKQGKELTLDSLSYGTHVITAQATDSDGLSSSRTFTVIAQDALPVIEFQQKDANGDFQKITSITGQKGDTAYFRLSASSIDAFASADCSSVTFSTSMTVTNTNNCDFAIALSQQGNTTLTATVADTNGKSGTASVALTVTAPPAVVSPQISQISATTPTRTVPDGGYLDASEQVTLHVDYLNAANANKKVRYAWSTRTTDGNSNVGQWNAMGSTDAATLGGSSRSFTAPNVFKYCYYYDFKVVVTDAVSGAIVTTKTFKASYCGPPA